MLAPNLVREVTGAYYAAIESGLRRFVECGVTVDRMALVTTKDDPYRTELHVDGVSRMSFTIRQPNYRQPRP